MSPKDWNNLNYELQTILQLYKQTAERKEAQHN